MQCREVQSEKERDMARRRHTAASSYVLRSVNMPQSRPNRKGYLKNQLKSEKTFRDQYVSHFSMKNSNYQSEVIEI